MAVKLPKLPDVLRAWIEQELKPTREFGQYMFLLEAYLRDVDDRLGVLDSDTSGSLSTKEPLGEFYGINTQTSSYTLVLADKGYLIEMNVGSANNLTIPPNSSVAFPVKTRIDVVQYGAGQTTFVAGSGVTIRSSGGKLKLVNQYSGSSLYKRATDEWVLVGDITT